MSEPAKYRLVRCPKCENLLPELTGYSVYQCGGCGAVLRADNKIAEEDTFSDEERVGEVAENFREKLEKLDFSEKRMMNLSDRSEKGVVLHDKWVVENDLEMNNGIDEMGNTKIPKEFEQLRLNNGNANANANGLRRSGRILDWRARERDEIEQFRNTQRVDVEGVRHSTSKYCEEGPSNYQLDSGYGYAEPVMSRNDHDPNGFDKIEYLEQDRAEILRKLDELKDQISRSCDVVDKPKQKVPLDRRVVHQDPYGGSENWLSDGSLGLNRASMQYPMPDKHPARPPYISHYTEPSQFTYRNKMDMQGFYPSTHNSNKVQDFGGPFRSQMIRRAPQYDMANMDPFERYPHDLNLHHPSCSCFHCYNKHQQVPPPASKGGQRFSDAPNNLMFNHNDYNPRFANPPPLNPHNPQFHTRWPSDINSFARHRPQRVVLATSGRHCRPIAGGAPFLTCYSCFELLQLPKKLLLVEKNQKKIRCEACSTVIFFAIANKKLVVSAHSEAKRSPARVDDRSNMMNTDFSSDEYDNSSYHFQSGDIKLASLCASEDVDSLDNVIATKIEAKSTELEMKTDPSRPPQGSPLQDHFDYSSKYSLLNRLGKGNRSGRSEREKVMPKKVTSRQKSVKDSAAATEIEISSNEYSNTVTSQDSSGDGSRGEDQLRVNKEGESFFGGIIKKSFRDFSRSNQIIKQGTINVTVNGHPITDQLVKKAEKLAGSIQPGQYWYDSRAGFWGVMGGPCLGIIPPLIEEFNYPMPENCAGGNTRIFVNGRELTEKDLNLLGSRGLSTEREKSYILEISGRILDEDSGEELNSLGKLAPTIEKVKHGFGMKVPRAAAK